MADLDEAVFTATNAASVDVSVKRTVVVLLVGLLGFAMLRPVCVPLTPQDLVQFNSPIEQRTDRDFYLRVFQQRHGQWCQCKTWISRQLFF